MGLLYDAYNLYKSDWTISHDLKSDMKRLKERYVRLCQNENVIPSVEGYEEYMLTLEENGDAYLSLHEFIETRFKDKEYMQGVLSREKFQEYLDFMTTYFE